AKPIILGIAPNKSASAAASEVITASVQLVTGASGMVADSSGVQLMLVRMLRNMRTSTLVAGGCGATRRDGCEPPRRLRFRLGALRVEQYPRADGSPARRACPRRLPRTRRAAFPLQLVLP